MSNAIVRNLRKPKLWVTFVLIAVLTWGVIFYWIAQPTRAEKFEIWLSADFELKKELTEQIAKNVEPYGIKKCVVGSYNPQDAFFPQAFSLRANSVDVYIMTADLAETIYQTNLFRELSLQLENVEYLSIDGRNYGIRFVGDYYMFVNSATKKSDELVKVVIETLLDGASR